MATAAHHTVLTREALPKPTTPLGQQGIFAQSSRSSQEAAASPTETRASPGAPCSLPAGCHGAIWVVMESSEKPHAHAEKKKFPQKIGSRRVVAQYFEITYLAEYLPSANTLAWSQSPPDNHHSDVFLSVSVLLAQF